MAARPRQPNLSCQIDHYMVVSLNFGKEKRESGLLEKLSSGGSKI